MQEGLRSSSSKEMIDPSPLYLHQFSSLAVAVSNSGYSSGSRAALIVSSVAQQQRVRQLGGHAARRVPRPRKLAARRGP